MTTKNGLPLRLHHHAWVVDDLEVNRRFYEDVIGLPLVATWTETDELFGAERVYCHTFFGIADGGALAFFQFANPEDTKLFKTEINFTPWRHIALKVDQEQQDALRERFAEAGYVEPDTFTVDHGYCVSLYITDPNGLQLEFVVDPPDVEAIDAERRRTAHEDLARWLGGDHSSNNAWRPSDAQDRPNARNDR
ncbi:MULTISPECIES: VOC family protein [Actinomadura]|uniref:VOC family protein n=1 Tax=Actinomadura yumaensis TaxID=111807 RepID=A0ABW2CF87_9ACTN|nr:VOC family protein [Actinomadura sp. J1-007]MWK34615.1 VOC family protein [Actinomadura sp. J1-007]